MNNEILLNRKTRAALTAEAEAIIQAALAEKRALRTDERERVDGLLAECDSLTTAIAAGEAEEKARVDDMLATHGLKTF